MARLRETWTGYAKAWKRLVSRMGHPTRRQCMCDVPRLQQAASDIIQSGTPLELLQTYAAVRRVCPGESALRELHDVPNPQCRFLAQPPTMRQSQRTLRHGNIGCGDTHVRHHDIVYFLMPWDWRPEGLREEPLATYEEFLAPFRGQRQPVDPDTTEFGCFQVDEPEEIESAATYRQLSDHIRDAALAQTLKEAPRDTWAALRDDTTSVGLRCALLEELACTREEDAARFVVEQLYREDLPRPWRDCLVLLAERVQFRDDIMRAKLRDRLFEIAATLSRSGDHTAKPIVFSAIRCYGSLIASEDAHSLLPFLEPARVIETRLVALQSIVHLFNSQPLQNGAAASSLADRVFDLAEKFLDRDWLVAGEKAAIGQNATHALAAMGDPRLFACIERIKTLALPWLSRQVAAKLKATLDAWKAKADQPPAFAFVQSQLQSLAQ